MKFEGIAKVVGLEMKPEEDNKINVTLLIENISKEDFEEERWRDIIGRKIDIRCRW